MSILDLLSGELVGKAFGSGEDYVDWPSEKLPLIDWPEDTLNYDSSAVQFTPGYVREHGTDEAKVAIDRRGSSSPWPLFQKNEYRRLFKECLADKAHMVHYVGRGDDLVGPIVASVEILEKGDSRTQCRALVRTKKYDKRLLLRLSDIEDAGNNPLTVLANHEDSVKQAKLKRLEGHPAITSELVQFEEKTIRPYYKFAVLYSKANQTEEDLWYNNREESPEFSAFLAMLGERVTLQGFNRYRGGLDVKDNQTGLHSVYTAYEDNEIMFHVSTMLAYHEHDTQQVERKRHLGNDVIMILFKDVDDRNPFDPKAIRSQFNHVFIVVRPTTSLSQAASTGLRFEVETIMKSGVYPFEPALPLPCEFVLGDVFRNWLLAKMVNGERAAFYAPDFVMSIRTTRKAQLELLVEELTSQKKMETLLGTHSHEKSGARDSSHSLFGGHKHVAENHLSAGIHSTPNHSSPLAPASGHSSGGHSLNSHPPVSHAASGGMLHGSPNPHESQSHSTVGVNSHTTPASTPVVPSCGGRDSSMNLLDLLADTGDIAGHALEKKKA